MDQVKAVVPEPYPFVGLSQYQPPFSFELKGQRFVFQMDDGADLEMEVPEKETSLFGPVGAMEKYALECLKIDDDTYLVNLKKENEAAVKTLVMDLAQGLVTVQSAALLKNPRQPGVAESTVVFGAIVQENGKVSDLRHGYTSFLTDKAIHWRFGSGEIIHAYASERYCRYARPDAEMQRLVEERADYIKIRDGIYAVIVNEGMCGPESEKGGNRFFLMNLDRMYAVGRVLCLNEAGKPEYYAFGACGRYVDQSALLEMKTTAFIR